MLVQFSHKFLGEPPDMNYRKSFTYLGAICIMAGFISARVEAKGTKPKLSKEEHHAKMLARFDADHDGKLDANEKAQLTAMREQHKRRREQKANRAAMDPEKLARRQKMTQKFDTNGDGTLDASEKAAMQAARAMKKQRMESKRGPALK